LSAPPPDSGPDFRSSTDPAEVRAHCFRACWHCLNGELPYVPRPTYRHTIEEGTAWAFSDDTRIAHRPTCPRVALICPENLRTCNDADELRRVCNRGCDVCRTTITLVLVESPPDEE